MTDWPVLPSAPPAPPHIADHGEVRQWKWGLTTRAGSKSTQTWKLKRRRSRSTFYRILHRIADLVKPKLRRIFIESVEAVQDAIPIDEIEKVLRGPNPEAALELIPWEKLCPFGKPAFPRPGRFFSSAGLTEALFVATGEADR